MSAAVECGAMRLELKYCERCGGLWLRERANGVPYCGGCERALAAMPSRSALAAMTEAHEGKAKRRRCARLPVERLAAAAPAEEMVLFPVCEPSSGLNNALGGLGGKSFREQLAGIFSLSGEGLGRGGRR